MARAAGPTVRFGRFLADLGTGELRRDDRRIPLQERPFQILAALLDRPGELVTREELRERLWPADVFVDVDNSLNTAVAKIRDALGDTAEEHRYIETLPKRGYRFVAPVQVVRADDASPPVDPPVEVAVAPFDRSSPRGDTKRTWFVLLAATGVLLAALGVRALWQTRSGSTTRHELLSASAGSHREASLSPDGSMVAFISTASGVPQVWIKNVAGGEPVQITFGEVPAARPRWSPRGDRILFGRADLGIWSVGTLGSPPARALLGHGQNPNFSSDGERIVFERNREIWIAQADGTGERRVEGVPEKTFDTIASSPAFSPDGQWIAFFHQHSGPNGDFWIVPAGGGKPRRLTFDDCEGGTPVWTPDSRALIVSTTRAGSRTLWRLPADGGEPVEITRGAGEDTDPALSTDGSTLVYTTVRNAWALMITDPESSEHHELLERRSGIWLPEVSPSGDRVAFFHDVGRDVHLFTLGINGTGLQQVTHGSGSRNIHPGWSADGASLHYYRERPTPTGFWQIALARGDRQEVMPGWAWERQMHARIDPSGRRVAYTLIGDRAHEATFVRDLHTGAETTLPLPHLHHLRWSPDGTAVMGWRHGGTIVTCASDGTSCRNIGSGRRAEWGAQGASVYIGRAAARPGYLEIWRSGLAGADLVKLHEIGPLPHLSDNFSVSPDGRVLWTQFRPGRQELWKVVLGTSP